MSQEEKERLKDPPGNLAVGGARKKRLLTTRISRNFFPLAKMGRHALQTILFGLAIVFICFVGQEPPGLRALGEVAPRMCTDRTFSYVSDVRQKEAEEWIRVVSPRNLRNFVGRKIFPRVIQIERSMFDHSGNGCRGGGNGKAIPFG